MIGLIVINLGGAYGFSSARAAILEQENNPPQAADDLGETPEDTLLALAVLQNDQDLDGDVLSISGFDLTSTQGGSISLDDQGTPGISNDDQLTYLPPANYSGPDSFSYQVSDSLGGLDNALVTVTISALNDPPQAEDDSSSTFGEQPTTQSLAANSQNPVSSPALTLAESITTIQVLTNDVDVDGELVRLASFDAQSLNGGSITRVDNGTPDDLTDDALAYSPAPGFTGQDQFNYSVQDSQQAEDSAAVNVEVQAVQQAPDAVDDSTSTNEDNNKNINVLGNDSDTDSTFWLESFTQPTSGTVTRDENGTAGDLTDDRLIYAPNLNFFGPDSFTYTVKDGAGDTDTANVSVTVNSVNDDPTISNVTNQTISEDGDTGDLPFTIGDVESDPALLNVAGSSSNLTLVPNANITFAGGSDANRTVKVTPAANQSGITTITLTVTDPNGGSSQDTFQVTVNAVNDNPTISNIGNQEINEDGSTGAVAFTVGDEETSAGSLTLSKNSSNTTLVPLANITFGGSGVNRTVTVDPAANQSGTATITVTVNDGDGGSAPDQFVVTVNAVNDAPNAVNDSANTSEDTAVTINVLNNDTDVDGTPGISSFDTSSAQGGTIARDNNGTEGNTTDDRLRYTPPNNFNGNDSFDYTISDGSLTDTATVTVSVSAANDNPTISNITDKEVNEDGSTGAIAFTIGDAETAAGDLTLDKASSNTEIVPLGNIVFGGSGANRTVTITPAADRSGTVDITVTVRDGDGGSASDQFTLTVNPINDAPTISNIGNQTIEEDQTTGEISFTVSDLESGGAGVTLSGSSSDTTLVPDANITFGGSGTNRTVTVAPAANRWGTAVITVTARDPQNASAVDEFTLTVTAKNDAPAINDDAFQVAEGGTLSGNVLSNDTDVENQSLTVDTSWGDRPNNDTTFVLNENGSFTYTHNGGQTTSDSFTYKACDSGTPNLCDTATVTITINPVNDSPLAVNDSYSTPEDTPLNVSAANGVLKNDSDPDGDSLSAIVVTDVQHGTLSLVSDGGFTYTPDENYRGSDSFEYNVCDSGSPQLCKKAEVSLTISGINDAPQALPESYTIVKGETLVVEAPGVLANDTDPDNDPLKAYLVTGPAQGTLTLGTGGRVTYTPPTTAFVGTVYFTYQASDSKLKSEVIEVEINVVHPDTPLVDWLAPGSNSTRVYVEYSEEVILEVSAFDNVEVKRVEFYRWDYVNEIDILIGTKYTAPYKLTFDTSTLLPKDNQITAYAFDNNNRRSFDSYILLYQLPPVYKIFMPVVSDQ